MLTKTEKRKEMDWPKIIVLKLPVLLKTHTGQIHPLQSDYDP